MPGKRIAVIGATGISAAVAHEMLSHLDKGDPDELRKQYMQEPELPAPPPDVLSIERNSPHFHPCYVRVGVRIDGVERTDIAYYNVNDKSYKTERNTSHLAERIEPYWRYQPSRQQRRAEERWAGKHK